MKETIKYNELIKNHEHLMKRLLQFEDKWYIFKNSKNTIWQAYQINGWFELLLNKNLKSAKQSFYNAAKVDVLYYSNFQEDVQDLFSAGRTHVLETALSDSKEIMNEYNKIDYPIAISKTRYEKYSEKVKKGETYIYCDLICKAMNRQKSQLFDLIKIVEDVTLQKRKING